MQLLVDSVFRVIMILVSKSAKCMEATRSKSEEQSTKRKSGGLFVPDAQDDYIIFLYISYRPAYDVSLNDDGWSSEIFKIVAGNTSTSWERLDVGAVLSHSFELESNVKTVFYSTPAVITFRAPSKTALQEAYSTSILPLEILSEKPKESPLNLAKRLLANYGSLVSVISIVVLFVYLVATPSKSGAAKGSKKKR